MFLRGGSENFFFSLGEKPLQPYVRYGKPCNFDSTLTHEDIALKNYSRYFWAILPSGEFDRVDKKGLIAEYILHHFHLDL